MLDKIQVLALPLAIKYWDFGMLGPATHLEKSFP